MSRWVCLRCYEANDEGAYACSNCGLLRGATPAPGSDGASPAAEAATPPQSRGLGWLLPLARRFWWILVIVAVAVGGFIFNAQRNDVGEITRSGNLKVTDLRIGDCFDLKDRDEEVTDEVEARPCAEAHEFELYHVGNVPGDDYPTDDAFNAWVGDNCVPAFGGYIGLVYEQSRFEIFWFQPSEDGWDSGDHMVTCAAFDPNNAELTSAVRDSAQ